MSVVTAPKASADQHLFDGTACVIAEGFQWAVICRKDKKEKYLIFKVDPRTACENAFFTRGIQFKKCKQAYYDYELIGRLLMISDDEIEAQKSKICRFFSRLPRNTVVSLSQLRGMYQEGAAKYFRSEPTPVSEMFTRDNVPMDNFLISIEPVHMLMNGMYIRHFTVIMLLSSHFSRDDQHYIVAKNMDYFTKKASRAVSNWCRFHMREEDMKEGFFIDDVYLFDNNLLRYIIKPKKDVRPVNIQ